MFETDDLSYAFRTRVSGITPVEPAVRSGS